MRINIKMDLKEMGGRGERERESVCGLGSSGSGQGTTVGGLL